ncbi:MAG TPA: diguanylate cyclase [Gemmatimonadaceae bacterium]|nr:diguanylate cyclase [Gemmatimonadaceae bacterium]
MAGDARPAARVLIVDDHPDNVEILRAHLEASGYRTMTATDGEEALELVAECPPDLILLDVMMPRLDGNEVARRIKADRSLPFIPIIMQTALDSVASKVEGLGAGADDYITKPVNYVELEARIRSMLRIKALQDEVQQRERDLARANSELHKMAVTDGLTGLFNRRHLEERLREMFEHSARLHEPLSCVMADIDHFKAINDRYGHQVGDEVLKQLAMLLRRVAREMDRVGRYGGEEFMVILPGTVLDACVTFAERARQEVADHVFTFDGGTLRATMSCGVAAWPHPRIAERDELVKAADDALYVAKALGRNRVVRFDSAEFNAHTENADDHHGHGAAAGRFTTDRA